MTAGREANPDCHGQPLVIRNGVSIHTAFGKVVVGRRVRDDEVL